MQITTTVQNPSGLRLCRQQSKLKSNNIGALRERLTKHHKSYEGCICIVQTFVANVHARVAKFCITQCQGVFSSAGYESNVVQTGEHFVAFISSMHFNCFQRRKIFFILPASSSCRLKPFWCFFDCASQSYGITDFHCDVTCCFIRNCIRTYTQCK